MDSYLMMLYVTLEQESALKQFFLQNGWSYSKPDLSVTTDQVGPAKRSVMKCSEVTISEIKFGKKKAISPEENTTDQQRIKLKITNVTGSSNTEHIETSEEAEYHDEDNAFGKLIGTSIVGTCAKSVKIPLTIKDMHGKETQIKVEINDQEMENESNANNGTNENIFDNILDNGENENTVDNNGDDGEDTDVDYSYENHGKLNVTHSKDKYSRISFGSNEDNTQHLQKPKTELSKIDGNFVCCICAKTFKTKRSMRLHENRHKGNRPYCCEVCGSAFSYKDDLIQHMARHSAESRYMCDFCGKKFNRRSCYHQHRRVHLPEKHFQCLQCGKSFVHKQVYLDHCETHTGKKQCQKCNKWVFHLNKHLKLCGSEENKYICLKCGYGFKRQRYLHEHCKSFHEGPEKYECQKCGKKYRLRSSLNYHKKKCNFS